MEEKYSADETKSIRIGIISLIAIIIMGGLFGIFGMLIGVPVFAVILQLINNYTINALRRKGLETELNHYYVGDSARILDKNKLIKSTDLLKRISNVTKKLLTKKTKPTKKEK